MRNFKKLVAMFLVMTFVFSFATPVKSKALADMSLEGLVTTVAATATTTTIQWAEVTGASKYMIVYADISKISYDDNGNINGEISSAVVDSTVTSYTLKGLGKANYLVLVAPYDANGVRGSAGTTYVTPKKSAIVGTLGTTTTLVGGTYSVDVGWNKVLCEGYEVQLCNNKGKVVKKKTITGYDTTICTFTNVKKTQSYYARVRAYNTFSGGAKKGKKYYSAWSKIVKKAVFVPQPCITSKNSDVNVKSVNLKWKKVKGATSYTVYGGTVKGKLKKITTVKSNKYTVTKVKGKSIDTSKRYYYLAVTANAKVKGKKKASVKYYYISAHTTIVYR
ncbi:MAG: hypothetical protein K5656_11875 [Lachnospiraceae bacterium]|nr:hypothetical protein [Lachnospiraceae bacterium]